MKLSTARVLMAGLLIAILPAGLQAQRKGTAASSNSSSNAVEIGMDGGFSFGLQTPSTVTFAIPFQNIRAAFPLNARWSLEPSVGLNYFHVSGGSLTQLSLLVGAPYTLNGATRRTGLYVRPFAGLTSASVGGGGGSVNSFVLGGGIGYKLAAMDRMAWRMEANFNHGFGGGDPSALNLLFGVSFFTK